MKPEEQVKETESSPVKDMQPPTGIELHPKLDVGNPAEPRQQKKIVVGGGEDDDQHARRHKGGAHDIAAQFVCRSCVLIQRLF